MALDLWLLIDGLRARGVRRFSGPLDGPGSERVEIELGPPEPPVQSVEPPRRASEQEAREQARIRNLEDEFRHVGGAPPWLTKQVVDDAIEQDPGDEA